jgi:uncharacterized repeat protein (TIGR03803 family)
LGTVFELQTGSGTITTLASFHGTDGAYPAGLVEDKSGNLFGVTYQGGPSWNIDAGTYGYGTVFEVEAGSETITTLAAFNGDNGGEPSWGLIEDSNGNLFGTTWTYGTYGDGTVFEIPYSSGTQSYGPLTTLATFNGTNGADPDCRLVEDSNGNLFGTTAFGGGSYDDGTVFEIPYNSGTQSYGALTTLATFNGSNGWDPRGDLVEDTSGDLFGTTVSGPTSSDAYGSVFEVQSGSGTVTTLAGFYDNNVDGLAPLSGVIEDSYGDLFGTTSAGGAFYGENDPGGTVFEVSPSTSVILNPTTLPAATVGASYSQTITASGGTAPYTYAVTAGSLPTGLSLSSAGVLSGTPTAAGSASFTVTATDSDGNTGSQPYTLTVGLALSPTTLPAATVGASYSQTITASGGTAPYTFAVSGGALPAGLSLSSAGVLSGTPTAGGSSSFTVTATDSNSDTGSQGYSLTVNPATITVAPKTVPAARVGASYSDTLTASGGTAPYTFAVTSGLLPAGLGLAASGVLGGTPTAGGSFSFTVTATDSSTGTGPYSGSRSYTLTVKAATITVSPSTLPAAKAGVSYSRTITASGGTAPASDPATPADWHGLFQAGSSRSALEAGLLDWLSKGEHDGELFKAI